MATTESGNTVKTFVAGLSSISRRDVDRVGSKAATLAELFHAGFRVPPGVVLTTAAFERFMDANQLDARSCPNELERAVIPDEITFEIDQAIEPLGAVGLAVRSSAIAEDLADASYAGQYETVLGVCGTAQVLAAIRRCWTSAFTARVEDYESNHGLQQPRALAILIQPMIDADSAGVALTANPVTGDRSETVISAVRGLGERLVSGAATPDEWVVIDDVPRCVASHERAITAELARNIAAVARRIEERQRSPQDVEWAVENGEIIVLQARPMTALSDRLSWDPHETGAWARNFRFGEWLCDPVTPLFESWLLTRLEERLYANYKKVTGVPSPNPLHVIVNGWYFCTLNFFPPTARGMLAMLVRYVLPRALVRPRRVSVMMPQTARFGVELWLREWRDEVLPRYRQIVEQAGEQIGSAGALELIRVIDDLAEAAGDYFTSLTVVAGFAWKAELPLANFYREHLQPRIGGSHQALLCGLGNSDTLTVPHLVQSLDWTFPTAGELDGWTESVRSEDGVARRRDASEKRANTEAAARAALAAEPKLLRTFERQLSVAQRFVPIRDENVSTFTLAWPVMRSALQRLAEPLVQQGTLESSADIYFLTRDELLSTVRRGVSQPKLAEVTRQRRLRWDRQRGYTPPLLIGEPTMFVKQMEQLLSIFGNSESFDDETVIRGMTASPGHAEGPVRCVRDMSERDRFRSGDVLVTPAPTPAMTPLYAYAAAIVADTGSPVAHAMLIAREFGIPAVVATGNATSKLRDGQVVRVDGNSGFVKLIT